MMCEKRDQPQPKTFDVRVSKPWRIVFAAGLIVVLTLLFFWKITFTNLILVGVDSFLYFYPYRDYVAHTLTSGTLPLWNPHLFLGAPLFANMQTAVLYPFHWPLLWLSTPKQYAASIVIHVIWAGLGTLLYSRRSLRLGWLGALTAGVIFGLGGFVGAQVEHINQLNTVAWLPWCFLLLDLGSRKGQRLLSTLGLGLTIAFMILAGHAQSVYICLFGLGLYALIGKNLFCSNIGELKTPRQFLKRIKLRPVIVLLAATMIAVLLAAVQLLPVLELSGLSVRSGGLSYREAVSFSLRPWLLHRTLLPPYGVDLSQVFGQAYGEYVAYVGVIGLGLAVLAVLKTWRQVNTRAFILLAAAGLFLALGIVNPFYYVFYKLVPGFDLFRAPARWMLLYAFGVAVLAGIGIEQFSGLKMKWNSSRFQRSLSWAVFALLCVELFVGSRGLRYNQATAPEAFSFLRPSIAHLKTDPDLHRFLSLSGIVYDPGDLAEIQAIFEGQLPDEAIYDYVVAAKEKEVLFYNLPLQYRFYSVDGYDGGLLPLKTFVTLERLFLEADNLSIDGRLRENLQEVPPGRLLSLLGVKYIITDKVHDVWIDGVFYDLQFSARLSPDAVGQVEATDLPEFPTTALGVISHLGQAAGVADGTPVARISVTDSTGWAQSFNLLAGQDTSQGGYTDQVSHQMARVGQSSGNDESGSYDYITLIDLESPHQLTDLKVEGLSPEGEFVLRGLSLVDARTNTSSQLTLSTEGRYKMVHSGDVKIYENLDVLPRAIFIPHAELVEDDETAITRLRDPELNLAQTVILVADETGETISLATTNGDESSDFFESTVNITEYAAEQVVVEVTTEKPGYLLLTDSFYPGWVALVDGELTPILQADVMFRAVPLDEGKHSIEFEYRPVSLRVGLWISIAGLAICLLLLAWALRSKPSNT